MIGICALGIYADAADVQWHRYFFPMARLPCGLGNHFGRRKDNNDVGYMFNDSFQVVLRPSDRVDYEWLRRHRETSRQNFCTKKFAKAGKLFGKGGQCALSETKLFKSWGDSFLPISAWQQIGLFIFSTLNSPNADWGKKKFLSNLIAFDNFRIWSRNSSFISLIKVFLFHHFVKVPFFTKAPLLWLRQKAPDSCRLCGIVSTPGQYFLFLPKPQQNIWQTELGKLSPTCSERKHRKMLHKPGVQI